MAKHSNRLFGTLLSLTTRMTGLRMAPSHFISALATTPAMGNTAIMYSVGRGMHYKKLWTTRDVLALLAVVYGRKTSQRRINAPYRKLL